MTDDDVRDMLRNRAAEARVSPDAWDRIAARIADTERPSAWWRDARVAVAAAVAALAGIGALVFGTQQAPVPVATQPPPSARMATPEAPHVWVSEAGVTMGEAAEAYVSDRTGSRPVGAEVTTHSADAGTVLYRSGPVVTEVFLVKLDDRWTVESAASDLVPLFDPEYDGQTVTATATVESDGELEVGYAGADGQVAVRSEPTPVSFRQQVELAAELPGERWVSVRAVLRTVGGGPVALSETWAQQHEVAPGSPDDGYPGVWPATRDELAGLQEQADAGDRPELFEPVEVATQFFADRGWVGEDARVSILWGDFQLGDTNSGELPYTVEETGSSGTVLLRRLGEDAIWFVVGAWSDAFEMTDMRQEGDTQIVDVRIAADALTGPGRLTGTAVTSTGGIIEATPLQGVEAGQTVSIGFPGAAGRAAITLQLLGPDGVPVGLSAFLLAP